MPIPCRSPHPSLGNHAFVLSTCFWQHLTRQGWHAWTNMAAQIESWGLATTYSLQKITSLAWLMRLARYLQDFAGIVEARTWDTRFDLADTSGKVQPCKTRNATRETRDSVESRESIPTLWFVQHRCATASIWYSVRLSRPSFTRQFFITARGTCNFTVQCLISKETCRLRICICYPPWPSVHEYMHQPLYHVSLSRPQQQISILAPLLILTFHALSASFSWRMNLSFAVHVAKIFSYRYVLLFLIWCLLIDGHQYCIDPHIIGHNIDGTKYWSYDR